jgi:hypothetical protein
LSESEIRMARLVRTIEGEIVPRLVLARRVSSSPEAVNMRQVRPPDACDVTELVRLLLAHDTGVGSAYVETVRQRGASLEMICLDLLAPAARELGLLWEEDECDFMQVTVGLCRLHQVLRDLSPAFGIEDFEHEADRRILLSPYPGDQHTFGITVVAQFLRRAGWDVWHEFPRNNAELLELTRQRGAARRRGRNDQRSPAGLAQSRDRRAGRRPDPGPQAGAGGIDWGGCHGGRRSASRAAGRTHSRPPRSGDVTRLFCRRWARGRCSGELGF